MTKFVEFASGISSVSSITLCVYISSVSGGTSRNLELRAELLFDKLLKRVPAMKAGCVLRFRMEELVIMQLSGECVE
jgi:hypothetical protein